MSRNPDKAWGGTPYRSAANNMYDMPAPAARPAPRATGTMGQAYRPSPAAPEGTGSGDQARRYVEFLTAQASNPIVGPSTSKTAEKYRGYDTQSQLWAAVEGAGLTNRDNAFQYAGQLASDADLLGNQVGQDTATAMEEARQAHEARQREFLQANNARGAEIDAAISDEYMAGWNPDDAREISRQSAADQNMARRYTAQAGGSPLPFLAPINEFGEGGSERLLQATGTLAEARNPGFAQAAGMGDGSSFTPDALARKYAESQIVERGLAPAAPARPEAGISDRMNELTGAADTALVAPREDRAVARDLEATPLSEFTQRAAVGQFGIDPYLAAGQFGQQMDVADFRTARDAQSIQETGMTYSEANAYAEKQARAQDAAMGDENRQMEEAIVQQVSSIVGMDADSLASAADIDVATLGSIVADPGFQQTQADLGAIVSSGDATQLAEALASVARIDMTAYRVLEQLYAPYLPGGYNPMDEGTWYGG